MFGSSSIADDDISTIGTLLSSADKPCRWNLYQIAVLLPDGTKVSLEEEAIIIMLSARQMLEETCCNSNAIAALLVSETCHVEGRKKRVEHQEER